MPTYYELMEMTRRGSWKDTEDHTDYEFKDGNDLDELARNLEVDSESMTVSTAIGIIRWLLKNDESVKGKYTFKKKK